METIDRGQPLSTKAGIDTLHEHMPYRPWYISPFTLSLPPPSRATHPFPCRYIPLTACVPPLSKAQFTRCLSLHGLWPGTSSEPENGWVEQGDETKGSSASPAVAGEEGLLRGIVLEAFSAKTPPRAPLLGRDPQYLGQRCGNSEVRAMTSPGHTLTNNVTHPLGMAFGDKVNTFFFKLLVSVRVESVENVSRGGKDLTFRRCDRLGRIEFLLFACNDARKLRCNNPKRTGVHFDRTASYPRICCCLFEN